MKKLLTFSFTALTALTVVMTSCRKNDNPKLPALISVPEPQFTKDATTDQIIAAQNPDAFSAKFTVGLYFASDVVPQKMDIMIMKNNDHTNIKTLQANVTTFPSVITITGVQIKALFGVSSALADSYDIGANITIASGQVIPAFSALSTATSYNSGVTTQGAGGAANTTLPISAPSINYSAVCKFTMTDYGPLGTTQTYKVVTDAGWADYANGQSIAVKIIDATHLSFQYLSNNPHDIVVTVNPVNNVTSVAKVDYGDYGPGLGGDFFAQSVTGNAANIVTPCELGVSVALQHTTSAGTYCSACVIKFKK